MIAPSSVREADAEMIRYSDTFDVGPRALVPTSTYVVDGGWWVSGQGAPGVGLFSRGGATQPALAAGWRTVAAQRSFYLKAVSLLRLFYIPQFPMSRNTT